MDEKQEQERGTQEEQEASFRDKSYTWEEVESWAEASVSGAFRRFLEGTGGRPRSWIRSVSVGEHIVVRSYWGTGLGDAVPGIPKELRLGRQITEVFDMEGNLIARDDPGEGRK